MLLQMRNPEAHQQQRELAEVILTSVRDIDQHAIVAGGAPRDWFLGTLANDIDIFVNNNVYNSLGSYNFLNLLRKMIDDRTESQYEYTFTNLGSDISEAYSSPHIQRVLEAEIGGQRFQFIICTGSTFGIVETFPFTLSRLWCVPRTLILGECECTAEVATDIHRKVLRFEQDINQANTRYFDKIVNRFPDWRLILQQAPNNTPSPEGAGTPITGGVFSRGHWDLGLTNTHVGETVTEQFGNP